MDLCASLVKKLVRGIDQTAVILTPNMGLIAYTLIKHESKSQKVAKVWSSEKEGGDTEFSVMKYFEEIHVPVVQGFLEHPSLSDHEEKFLNHFMLVSHDDGTNKCIHHL
jgi:hypothetical protein